MTQTQSQGALQAHMNRIFTPLLAEPPTEEAIAAAYRVFQFHLTVQNGRSRQEVFKAFLFIIRKLLARADERPGLEAQAAPLLHIFAREVDALLQRPTVEAIASLQDAFPVESVREVGTPTVEESPVDSPLTEEGKGKWKALVRGDARQKVCEAEATFAAAQWVVKLIQWSGWSFAARVLLCMALLHSEDNGAKCVGLCVLYAVILPMCDGEAISSLSKDAVGYLVSALVRPVQDTEYIQGIEAYLEQVVDESAKRHIVAQCAQTVALADTATDALPAFDLFDLLMQIGAAWTQPPVLATLFKQISAKNAFAPQQIAKALWRCLTQDFTAPAESPEELQATVSHVQQLLNGATGDPWRPVTPSPGEPLMYAKLLVDALHEALPHDIRWDAVWRALDTPSIVSLDAETYALLSELIDYAQHDVFLKDGDAAEGSLSREGLEKQVLLYACWGNYRLQLDWIGHAFLGEPNWCEKRDIMSTLLRIAERPAAQQQVHSLFMRACESPGSTQAEREFRGIRFAQFLLYHAQGANDTFCTGLISDIFQCTFAKKDTEEIDGAALMDFIEVFSKLSKQTDDSEEVLHHTIPTDADTRWMHTLAAALLQCARKGSISTPMLLSFLGKIPDSAFVTAVLTQAPTAIAFAVFQSTEVQAHMPAVRGWIASTFFEPQRTESFLHPASFIQETAHWIDKELSALEKETIVTHKEKLHAMLGVLSSSFCCPSALQSIEGTKHRLHEALLTADVLDPTLVPHPVLLNSEDASDAASAMATTFPIPIPSSKLSPDEYARRQELQAKRDAEERRWADETAAAMVQQVFAGKLAPDAFLQALAEVKRKAAKKARDLLQEAKDRKANDGQRYKKPQNQRQATALFTRIVDMLWAECPKFADYPAAAQGIAVKVLGGVILYDLFPNAADEAKTITALLKFVLQSIGKPKKPAAQKFGIRVLAVFLARVPQWPQYCKHLHVLLHAQGIGKELRDTIPTIQTVLAEAEAEDSPEAIARTDAEWKLSTMALDRRSIAKRLVELDEHTLVLPPTGIRHRVAFILNNLTADTVEQAAMEIAPLVETPSTAPLFFARYLVEKRVAAEPNYHASYAKMLERIGNRVFEKTVLSVSYCMTQRCLASEGVRTSSSERTVLKNIGSWIGLMTLRRDRPIVARELNVHDLLLEGLAKGKLIAVVPFVSKILEGSASSKVFTVQSPWVLSVFAYLVEIYALSNVKVNIRFELEVLCKKMNVNLRDIDTLSAAHPARATAHAVVEEMHRNLDFVGSVDFTMPPPAPKPAPQLKPPMQPYDTHRQKMLQSPQKAHQQRVPHTVVAQSGDPRGLPIKHEHSVTMKPNWMENLDVIQSLIPPFRVPTNLNAFLQQKRITLTAGSPKLSDAVPSIIASILKLAVEVAVKEVLLPVVERSVVIASNTTRELIRKDFANDTDDVLLENSAKAMVKSLASSLAVVTAKEPLRASTRRTIQSSILSSFALRGHGMVGFHTVGHDDEGKGKLPTALLHELVDLILHENKEGLGVLELVERVAAESAISRIAEFCASFQEERLQNRRVMQAVGRNFPSAAMQHPFMASLPASLRTSEGLQPGQQAIYDDFAKLVAFRAPIAKDNENTVKKVLERLNSLITHIEQEAVEHYRQNPKQYLSLTREEFASSTLSPSHESIKKCLYLVPDLVKSIRDDADVLQLVQFTYRNLVSMTNSMGNTTVSSASIIQHINNASGSSVVIPAGALILNLVHESYLLILQSAKERMAPRGRDGRMSTDDATNSVIQAITRLFIDDEQSWELKDLCVGFIRLRLIDIGVLDAHVKSVLMGILDDGANGGLFAPPGPHDDGTLQYTPETRLIFEFAGGLVQSCLVDEKITRQHELAGTIEALEAVASEAQRQQKAHRKATGQRKTTSVRVPTYLPAATTKQRVFVWNILEDWRQHQIKWEASKTSETCRDALKVALQNGLLTGARPIWPEEHVARYIEKISHMCTQTEAFVAADFFQLAVESAVTEFATHCTAGASESPATARRAYDAIDALSAMVIAISTDRNPFWRSASNDGSVFPALFEGLTAVMRANHGHFTGEMASCPHDAVSGPYPSAKDAVVQQQFQQQPYFRLLSNLLCAQQAANRCTSPDHPLKLFSSYLVRFLQKFTPGALPGFTFAWASLVFHRELFPALLQHDAPAKGTMPVSAAAAPAGWSVASELLTALLKFLAERIKVAGRCEGSVPEPVSVLYTATLRGVLVLLHDFPEFLCLYADALIDKIPSHCVQLRNAILSAFPRSIRLPDPFTPNLKVDLLPESTQVPVTSEKYIRVLKSVRLSEKGGPVDDSLWDFLASALHRKVKLATAVQRIAAAWRDPSLSAHSDAIISATVHAIARAAVEKSEQAGDGRQEAQTLLCALCAVVERPERFAMLSALVDQLRYPNRLTLYCSFLLLSLFCTPEADIERFTGCNAVSAKSTLASIQEQITRVLFQRLIGNRPHPWGLLITFIEIVKNPRYAFWKKPYVHNSTPALRKLFETVAQSCAPSEAVVPAK